MKCQLLTKWLVSEDIFCSMQYGNIPLSIKEVPRQESRQFLSQIRADVDLKQWAFYGTVSISRITKKKEKRMTSLTF